jgi:hypothetical protein
MPSKRERAKKNRMTRSVADIFQNLDLLNVKMLMYDLINEPCSTLDEAYETLSKYYFSIFHFAIGIFKKFDSYIQLRRYINGAERTNGFNPLKFPLKMAKAKGFDSLLVKL